MPIENKKQYNITKRWAERFKLEIDRLPPTTQRTIFQQARIDSLASMLVDLDEQLSDYEKFTPPLID